MVERRVVPGELVVGAGEAPAFEPWQVARVEVTNRGRNTAYLTSHFPLAWASRALELDRSAVAGARPLLPAGASVAIDPGETIELEVTWD